MVRRKIRAVITIYSKPGLDFSVFPHEWFLSSPPWLAMVRGKNIIYGISIFHTMELTWIFIDLRTIEVTFVTIHYILDLK